MAVPTSLLPSHFSGNIFPRGFVYLGKVLDSSRLFCRQASSRGLLNPEVREGGTPSCPTPPESFRPSHYSPQRSLSRRSPASPRTARENRQRRPSKTAGFTFASIIRTPRRRLFA